MNQSSPVGKRLQYHADYNRKELQHTIDTDMPIISQTNFTDLLLIPSSVTSVLDTIAYHEPDADNLKDHTNQIKFLLKYGNKVSSVIRKKLFNNDKTLPVLAFASTGNHSPADHPTSTDARPDITVYFKGKPRGLVEETTGKTKVAVPYWAQLESLGEVHSSSSTRPDSLRQTIAYTLYLLQVRPDRTTVLTFWIGKAGMSFTLADVTGCKQTSVIGFHGADGPSLHKVFCAFVYRLYLPHSYMMDPTIDRAGPQLFPAENGSKGYRSSFLFYIDPPADKSDIDTPVDKSKSPRARYQIIHVGYPTGRRSTVFKCFDNPIVVNGMEVIIIKEQYIPSGRRFTETEVIHHIHQDGIVPGVVQMIFNEEVMWKGWDGFPAAQIKIPFNGEAGKTYNKIRIGQCDMGVSILNTRTPRELLIGVYDLLAVTRYLYSERKVLHRDISTGNVMCILEEPRSETSDNGQTEESIVSDKDDPEDASISDDGHMKVSTISPSKLASARYLLGEVTDPMALSCTLIDFDHAEILGVKPDAPRAARTGTPLFIARAVNQNHPIAFPRFKMPSFIFMGMPDAPDSKRYKKIHAKRVEYFPMSEETIVPNKESGKSWRHELRHDAESALWLIVCWAIQAYPEGGAEVPIPSLQWGLFTHQKPEYRSSLIENLVDDQTIHDKYAYLGRLIQELWLHIQYDHHYAPPGILSHDEYVHEAFQRCILSFLMEHRNPKDEGSRFMTLIKAKTHRGLDDENGLLKHTVRLQVEIEKFRNQSSNRNNVITSSALSNPYESNSSSPSTSLPPLIPKPLLASNKGEGMSSALTSSLSNSTPPPQGNGITTRSQSRRAPAVESISSNCSHGSKRGAPDSVPDDHSANKVSKASKKARRG